MDIKNVHVIRRENMEALFVRFKDWVWARFPKDPERGMMTRFANAIDSDPDRNPARYLSHVWRGRKEIGHGLARQMEAGMRTLGPEFDDVVDNWLDNDHTRPTPKTYGDESLHKTLEDCFRVNPRETQRVMNELASKLFPERDEKL